MSRQSAGENMARRDKPTLGWVSPNGGLDDETHEFYKGILKSNRLRSELKRELELIVEAQAQEQSLIEQARMVASQQARKTYRCEGCGLEFMGILAFAEHDEETSHMTDRGKKVQVDGQV